MIDLERYEQIAREFGSSNCWTGTSGTLAGIILELVREVKRLQDERSNPPRDGQQ
jgi:hypothetical protein